MCWWNPRPDCNRCHLNIPVICPTERPRQRVDVERRTQLISSCARRSEFFHSSLAPSGIELTMGRAEAVTEQAPTVLESAPRKLRRNSWSFDRLKSLGGDISDDLIVLRHLWLSNLVPGKKKSSATHAQRLESFYGPQAAACKCLIVAAGPVQPYNQQGHNTPLRVTQCPVLCLLARLKCHTPYGPTHLLVLKVLHVVHHASSSRRHPTVDGIQPALNHHQMR